MNLEALNNLLMFVITPLGGALVGLIASHQAKASVLTVILFAIGGLLFGIVSAFAAKPMVVSVASRALWHTSVFSSSLLIGACSLIVMLQLLVVVLGIGFLANVIL